MLSRNLPVKIEPQQNEVYDLSKYFANNLFDYTKLTYNKYVSSSGAIANSVNFAVTDFIKIKPNTTYVLSGLSASSSTAGVAIYSSKDYSTKTQFIALTGSDLSIVTEDGDNYLVASVRTVNGMHCQAIIVEYGKVGLPPIIKGTYNTKTGVLTSEYGYIHDISAMIWNAYSPETYSGIFRMSTTITNAYSTSSAADRLKWFNCSYFPPSADTAWANMSDKSIQMYQSNRPYIKDTDYDGDAEGFAESLKGKGIQLVYRLVAPITFQLDPQDIKIVKGKNTISTTEPAIIDLTYKNVKGNTVELEGNPLEIKDGIVGKSLTTCEVEMAINQFFNKIDLANVSFHSNLPGLPSLTSSYLFWLPDSNQFLLMFLGFQTSLLKNRTFEICSIENFGFIEGTKFVTTMVTDITGSEHIPLSNSFLSIDYIEKREGGGGIRLTFSDEITDDMTQFFFNFVLCDEHYNPTEYVSYNNYPSPIYPYNPTVKVDGDYAYAYETARRLKTTTRPVFQWDTGLSLVFDGYDFEDGTECQFDNKLTSFSQNEIIVGNSCPIPNALLDENCQGDIVAYVNIIDADYEVVVYEVYIPVIKRPKPESFLRPAIDIEHTIIASFNDGADDVPLEKLDVLMTYSQSGTGDPSPTNVRAISGYTESKLIRAGKNLYSFGDQSGVRRTDILYFDVPLPAGYYTISATPVSSDTDSNTCNVAFSYVGGGTQNCQLSRNTRNSYGRNFATPIAGLRFYASNNNANSADDTFSFSGIQLEAGSSMTAYEDYVGETYTNSFAIEGENVFTTEGATEGKYLSSSGSETTGSSYSISDYLLIEPQKRYVFEGFTTGATSCYHAYYDYKKELIGTDQYAQEGFITPPGSVYMRVSYLTASAPTSLHVSAGIIVDATLDVLTGVLTVRSGYISDLSKYWWRQGGSSSAYDNIYRNYTTSGIKQPDSAAQRQEGIVCSNYKVSSATSITSMDDKSMLIYGAMFYFRDSSYTTSPTDFSEAIAGADAIYPLENPCIYQLTPHEVKTLLGFNNIWADSGEVEVSYFADQYLHLNN